MNEILLKSELIGAVFVIITGTLFHFLYQWSGGNRAIGYIAAVNESTWEHLKLLFFPMLFYSVIQFATVGYKIPGFLPAKALGLLIGLVTVVVLFYTYTGVIGKNYLVLDIMTFILGVAAAYWVSFESTRLSLFSGARQEAAGVVLLLLLLCCFLLFTRFPPHIALFKDPLTGSYGFKKVTK